ncbi:VOC family protein [Candidatus Rariloculus sp.]|uniref:VOC family protein n=1 Tax=Candidatus Rariloculus sp. TaxID=3101265 RepID=UPI003D099D66
MPLQKLEHVTVNTDDLDKTRDFYCNVLGMTDGYRPDLGFEGAWLYVGDTPCIHVCEWESYKTYAEARSLPMSSRASGTGSFDHVAFNAEDYDGAVARLETSGLKYSHSYVPDIPLRQIFVRDPNGVCVELNFRGD